MLLSQTAVPRCNRCTSCHELLQQYEEVKLIELNGNVRRLLNETKEVRKAALSIAKADDIESLDVAINCFHVILNEEEEEL